MFIHIYIFFYYAQGMAEWRIFWFAGQGVFIFVYLFFLKPLEGLKGTRTQGTTRWTFVTTPKRTWPRLFSCIYYSNVRTRSTESCETVTPPPHRANVHGIKNRRGWTYAPPKRKAIIPFIRENPCYGVGAGEVAGDSIYVSVKKIKKIVSV